MPRRIPLLLVALSICRSSPLVGQIPDWVNQILIAAELPVSTAKARNEGAPSAEIRQVLDAMVTARVPAHEARGLIDDERTARREHGPVDNFGAFVQAKLQAGLRGRELAAAIRAEHAARGKGKAAGQRQGQAKGRSGEPTDTARAARGRKDAAPLGKAAPNQKRPDDKGRPPSRPVRPTR